MNQILPGLLQGEEFKSKSFKVISNNSPCEGQGWTCWWCAETSRSLSLIFRIWFCFPLWGQTLTSGSVPLWVLHGGQGSVVVVRRSSGRKSESLQPEAGSENVTMASDPFILVLLLSGLPYSHISPQYFKVLFTRAEILLLCQHSEAAAGEQRRSEQNDMKKSWCAVASQFKSVCLG